MNKYLSSKHITPTPITDNAELKHERHAESLHPSSAREKFKSGAAPGRRGRQPATAPTSRQLEMLLATRNHTYEEVGAARGISRQRVAQIAHRWSEYLPIRPLPKREVVENAENGKPKRKKLNRIHVISFRLTDPEFRLLRCRYPEVKSVDRAARVPDAGTARAKISDFLEAHLSQSAERPGYIGIPPFCAGPGQPLQGHRIHIGDQLIGVRRIP
jgi:hypothetical protein